MYKANSRNINLTSIWDGTCRALSSLFPKPSETSAPTTKERESQLAQIALQASFIATSANSSSDEFDNFILDNICNLRTNPAIYAKDRFMGYQPNTRLDNLLLVTGLKHAELSLTAKSHGTHLCQTIDEKYRNRMKTLIEYGANPDVPHASTHETIADKIADKNPATLQIIRTLQNNLKPPSPAQAFLKNLMAFTKS